MRPDHEDMTPFGFDAALSPTRREHPPQGLVGDGAALVGPTAFA
jgi:hypothetical protein